MQKNGSLTLMMCGKHKNRLFVAKSNIFIELAFRFVYNRKAFLSKIGTIMSFRAFSIEEVI